MDKLPPEILQNIFILLSLGERVKCLRVCRTWWNVLDKYCLFYNITFRNNVNQFKKLMTVMEQSPRHAAQVTELELKSCLPSDFNKRKLCIVFPNVQTLLVITNSLFDQKQPANHFEEPLAMAYSNSKVKAITDYGHCELASQMLSLNLCGRLKKLDLNFFNQDIGTAHFRQLKNLPNLERLIFANLKIRLNDLEVMHNNLPALREFSIQLTLLPSGMPDNIVPLPPTNYFLFYIQQVDDIKTHIALYKYMVKKYVNAKGGKCIDECMDKYTPSEAKRIYESAVFDFFRLFAPKRSGFTASHVPNGINIFNAFDDVGCRFETFTVRNCESDTLIEDLAQSKQSRYVEDLDITNTPMDSPDVLKNMAVLTTLTMACYRDGHNFEYLDVSNILNGLPKTVTKFILGCHVPTGIASNTTFTFIQDLCITCDDLTKEICDVISTSFPKLVTLELHGNITDSSIVISLSNDSLKSVSVAHMEGIYGFSFKSASQTDPQHYFCNNNRITDATYDDIQLFPNFLFISYKEMRLDLSDYIKIFSVKETSLISGNE